MYETPKYQQFTNVLRSTCTYSKASNGTGKETEGRDRTGDDNGGIWLVARLGGQKYVPFRLTIYTGFGGMHGTGQEIFYFLNTYLFVLKLYDFR